MSEGCFVSVGEWRIRDDRATETKFSEIKLRAVVKIGELSRELEKAESHGGKINFPPMGSQNLKR